MSLVLPKASWLRDYVELWPTIESPETYIIFPVVSAFGACLARRCWFDQDFVKIYPMLNLLLIGPSGLGKSTCLGIAMQMIESLPIDKRPRIMGPNTKEGLHKELMACSRAMLTASELANFFNKAKYNEALIPYITELLDYKDYIECNTKSGGTSQVICPSVTIAGGSTIEWLSAELPNTAGSGGFLPRFLIIVEERKRQKVALPGHVLTSKQRDDLDIRRSKAKITFSQLISQAPTGAIPLRDWGVAEIFTHWYESQTPTLGHLEPFVARSRETVLRLAMLLCLTCGAASISEEHMLSAIGLYELATTKLAKVAAPSSIEGRLLAEVIKALGWTAKSDKELYVALENLAPVQRINAMVESHILSGAVHRREDDGKLIRIR